MTITDGLHFDLLTAPLATIDRRGLSQAWYSALCRSASAPRSPEQPALPKDAGPARRSKAPIGRTGNDSGKSLQPETTRVHRNAPERSGGIERRATQTRLERVLHARVERAARGGARHAFTLRAKNGRVHLVLQRNGAGMQLIAICAPADRAEVARALRRARYALASRGIDVAMQLKEHAPC